MRIAALIAACAVSLTGASAALAGSVRTAQTPEQIRAYKDSGASHAALTRSYATATTYVKAQLRRKVRRPAVVLDIDETAMWNYGCLDAVDFDLSGVATCVLTGESTAIAPARAFYRAMRARRVTVVFVTGAPTALCNSRAANLRAQGFTGTLHVTCRPSSDTNASVVPYKSDARRRLQRSGYTILANIGDQRSDLAGGAARRTFKLVNPIYVTA